ncbi:hypothetical protein FRC03_010261 [Tulasnella sp. 419]|nr:hypothetical protein FRC03_010261 [Tulasnella sp. 419]
MAGFVLLLFQSRPLYRTTTSFVQECYAFCINLANDGTPGPSNLDRQVLGDAKTTSREDRPITSGASSSSAIAKAPAALLQYERPYPRIC